MIRTIRLFALMTAVLLAAALSLASTAGANRRAHSAASKAYTVKVTVKKGKNLVLLIVGRSGSLLASAPSNSASQATTLKIKSVSTLAGASDIYSTPIVRVAADGAATSRGEASRTRLRHG